MVGRVAIVDDFAEHPVPGRDSNHGTQPFGHAVGRDRQEVGCADNDRFSNSVDPVSQKPELADQVLGRLLSPEVPGLTALTRDRPGTGRRSPPRQRISAPSCSRRTP